MALTAQKKHYTQPLFEEQMKQCNTPTHNDQERKPNTQTQFEGGFTVPAMAPQFPDPQQLKHKKMSLWIWQSYGRMFAMQ